MARISGESRMGIAAWLTVTWVSIPMSGSAPSVRPDVMTNGRSVVACSSAGGLLLGVGR